MNEEDGQGNLEGSGGAGIKVNKTDRNEEVVGKMKALRVGTI